MIYDLENSSEVSACPSDKDKALDSTEDKVVRMKHKVYVDNFCN